MEKALRKICEWTSYLIYALVLVVVVAVILRYVFGTGVVALEELNWHLFAIIFLLGLTYAQLDDKHVAVDILSSKFSARARGAIGFIGYAFLLLPFLYVVFYHSIPFVYDSYRTMEKSLSPSGLSFRFLIKSVLPLSILLLACSSLMKMSKFYKMLRGNHGS